MSFAEWKPSTFMLDDYQLFYPQALQPSPGKLTPVGELGSEGPAEKYFGTWEEAGLDERIGDALRSKGADAPTELQTRIVNSLLASHHLEISCPRKAGAALAVLASSLHAIPPPPRDSASILFLTGTPSRAIDLYERMKPLVEPCGAIVVCCHDHASLSGDLDRLRGSETPHIIIATLGRATTLSQHYALRYDTLSFLCLDFAHNSKIAASHHTTADVRNILKTLDPKVQVVVLCPEGYKDTGLSKVVGKHQETSMKANLGVPRGGKSGEASVEEDTWRWGDVGGRAGGVAMKRDDSDESKRSVVSEEWRKVVLEFEHTGLRPADFLAVRASHDERIANWADRVSEELGKLPQASTQPQLVPTTS